MSLSLFQIDAFSDRVFGGNPAAVIPLSHWPKDDWLQQIAEENNLSETAFFRPSRSDECDFDLRWFTPTQEVDLCGHATLAAAHVLYAHLGWAKPSLRFHSKSGVLRIERQQDLIWLDFPSRPPEACRLEIPTGLPEPEFIGQSVRDLLWILDREQKVLDWVPDPSLLVALPRKGLILSAPSKDSRYDFVSRFFAPELGVLEDPVTGSAHCVLVPYWADRLGKSRMRALQVHRRRGELDLEHVPSELGENRVRIGGRAVTYCHGSLAIEIPT